MITQKERPARLSFKEEQALIDKWERYKRYMQEASKQNSQQGSGNSNDDRKPDDAAPECFSKITPAGNLLLAGKSNLITRLSAFKHSVFRKLIECFTHTGRGIAGKKA